MSWWKSSGPSSREAQLAAFERAFPSARKTVQGSSCHYDVCFSPGTAFRSGFSAETPQAVLRIFLPQGFPEDKPALQLLSKIVHPWVNQYNQVVGPPELITWRKEFELSTVVQRVISELSSLPPSSPIHPSSMPIQIEARFSPPSYEAISSTISSVALEIPTPPIPDSFPELDLMSVEELETLLNDEVAFYSHVSNQILGVKTMQEMRSDALVANFTVAQATLAQREEVTMVREEAMKLQEELARAKGSYERKVNEHVALEESRTSNAVVLEKMRKETDAAEEVSECLNEKFCNNSIEVGEFVKQYRAVRHQYHARHACVELESCWIR